MSEVVIIRPGDPEWAAMPAYLRGHTTACVEAACKRHNCTPDKLDVYIECHKGQIPLIRIKKKKELVRI